MQKTIPPSAGEWFSTADGHWSNSSIRLEEHPTAREQALALRKFPPGTTVVRSTALAFVLTEKEKGQRCDACFRLAGPKSSLALRKCSGCAAYWYCGTECELLSAACVSCVDALQRPEASMECLPQTHVQDYKCILHFRRIPSSFAQ